MLSMQILVLGCICAAVSAGVIGQSYPNYENNFYVGYGPVDYQNEEYTHQSYHRPKYNFDYSVNDPHTGDHKSQWETRDGDVVKGGYTVAEPDGTTRIVEYTADSIHGFNAVVKRVGQAHHPATYNTGLPSFEHLY